MKDTHNLIQQIRRKQFLICAYGESQNGVRHPVTLEKVADLLQMTSPVCEVLARRLSARGLINLIEDELGAASIHLTGRGERLLARMGQRPDRT